jgi:hypothetical protein
MRTTREIDAQKLVHVLSSYSLFCTKNKNI